MTIKKESEEIKNMRNNYFKVPYAFTGLLCFLIIQTGGAIWWASGQSTKSDFILQTQQEIRIAVKENSQNRYTSIQAQDDWRSNDSRLKVIEKDVEELKNSNFEIKTILTPVINNKKFKKMLGH